MPPALLAAAYMATSAQKGALDAQASPPLPGPWTLMTVRVYIYIYMYIYIYINIYIYGSMGVDGGSIHPLTAVFALSADFSEHGVPLVGVYYTFSESHRRGLLRDVWLGGGWGTIFLRILAVTVDDLGFFSLFWSGSGLAVPHCRCVDRNGLVRQLVSIFWGFYGFSMHTCGKCINLRASTLLLNHSIWHSRPLPPTCRSMRHWGSFWNRR